MDSDSLIYFAALTLFSGFLNYAKVSLLSLRRQKNYNGNNTRQQKARENDDSSVTQANLLTERAGDYLLIIFTVQNLIKAAAAILLFRGLYSLSDRGKPIFNPTEALLLTLAIIFVLFVGVIETLVRALARSNFKRAYKIIFGPVQTLHFVAKPLTLPCELVIRWFRRILKTDEKALPIPAAADDLIEEEADHFLEESEMEMISSIVEFKDTIVREVMVPRVDMKCIPAEAALQEVRAKIVEYSHSRLPVYRENIDNIVGIVLARDLLMYMEHEDWQHIPAEEVMHEVNFVPETKNISDLLREFQQSKTQLAIVVDEYGGTAGLVSIEDLIEEIVGEIQDEYDMEKPLYIPAGDGSYIIDAKMPISELAEELGINLPEESEYDTVGGFVFTRMGKVPRKGEVFTANGVTITIIEADDRKVHKVKMNITPSEGLSEKDDSRE